MTIFSNIFKNTKKNTKFGVILFYYDSCLPSEDWFSQDRNPYSMFSFCLKYSAGPILGIMQEICLIKVTI